MMYFFLCRKYITEGECAAITYYTPLTIWDRIIYVAISLIGLLISIKINKPTKAGLFLLSVIYLAISIIFSLFGNQILEMRTEQWPHEYHVQPLLDT